MPEHSKEQILAALEAAIQGCELIPAVGSPEATSANDIFARHSMEFIKGFTGAADKASANGDTRSAAIYDAIGSIVVSSITLGLLAAQRLQEIDQLESMELTDA